MEISQTALAALMVCAVPIGITLNVLYRIFEFPKGSKSWIAVFLTNVKDFGVMIIAAVMTVVLSYYFNDGDYRYLAMVGALIGYVCSDLLLRKPILCVRDWVLSFVGRIVSVPLSWIWNKTFGEFFEKFSKRERIKNTKKRIEYMVQNASIGFENNAEAKE